MPDLTFMPDVLRDAGLPVRVVPGWESRGHGAMNTVLGVLVHHTAGAATGLFPSERVVVEGRSGLAGPLCNLGLDRAGTWIVVAAGQAWHAGTGSAPWCPANQGNSRLIGVEAESVGTRDDWTAAQRESYPRGVAALLRHLGLPASRVIGHKEWAPGRKIDPAFWDMNAFRADTARWMTNPTAPSGRAFMALSDAEQRELLDATRKLVGWLSMPSFVPPGADPSKPWTVSPGAALLNLYVGMFYGGSSTGNKSLFQHVAAASGTAEVDTAAIVAGVVDALTEHGIAGPVADELARRLSSPSSPTVKESP